VSWARDAAQITVCHYAADAAEAELFMRMLGIHPDQDEDDLAGPHTPPVLNGPINPSDNWR
jgi:hypothetical protein